MNQQTLELIAKERKGKKLVFTNGVFDILHAGHVRYLQQAKDLGDLLVVALNTDSSVRKLNKAPDRPINSLQDRMTIIAALKSVDFVLSFEEQTPEQLIEILKPDMHIKGGDYKPDQLPETKIVQSYGGEVIILPFLTGRSTTEILRKLKNQTPD